MAYGTKVAFEAVREVAFGAIGVAYSALGAITSDYVRILALNNGTDAAVYISFDGVTDHLRVSPNSFKLLDFTTNTVHDNGYFLPLRTQIYIKRVSGAPTLGDFWAETVIGQGGK